jgi:uncharacterized protein
MNVTISGASGFIGQRLLKVFGDGHRVHALSRHGGSKLPAGIRFSVWDPVKGEPPAESLREADLVVHLAGEPVAQRWTADVKRRIRESRVAGTRNLVAALAKLPRRPAALVCASAIGYYGSRGDEALTEAAPPGSDFLADVCAAWEHEAQAAEAAGVRVVRVRIGIVLDPHGGALKRMLPPFRLGIGGRLADGSQWMSWIHLQDLANLFLHAAEHPVQGVLNGVAPSPVTNADFTLILARTLHRPALFPVPAFALRAMFGEMSQILLASQRVIPTNTEASGFRFRFRELGPALEDLLTSGA